MPIILLTKITAQKEVALSYQKVRGLYYLAIVFAVTIVLLEVIGLLTRPVQ